MYQIWASPFIHFPHRGEHSSFHHSPLQEPLQGIPPRWAREKRRDSNKNCKTYRLKNVFSFSSCTRDLSPELDARAEKAPSLRSRSWGGPNSTTLPGSSQYPWGAFI